MEEKVLNYKKNGIPMLLLFLCLSAAGIACFILGVISSDVCSSDLLSV